MPLCDSLFRRAYFSRLRASVNSIVTIAVGFAMVTCWTNIASVCAGELAEDYFATEVRPLLEQHCVKCHSGDKAKGGLRLTDRKSLLKGGDSGSAVDLEHVAKSLLIAAVNYESYEMPPIGQLPQESIDKLTAWVSAGVPWPKDQRIKAVASKEESHIVPPTVNEETRRFWSFNKPERPAVPAVDNPWIRDPVDRFILRRLNEAGLQPNQRASRQTLIRRAYYDLTGLPPTADQVAEYVADDSPNAWARLINRLLASPHYGEKWGRHWLDLVRFAETNSYERDATKPNAWRYRDYVIESFNKDKPYDEFLREQLAGDEIPDHTDEQLIATGFYRLGSWDDEPVDADQALYDDLDDILTTTCQSMLGLTINCARCHDHKLDPISQDDYYSMLGFFAGVTRYGGPNRGRDLKYSQVLLGPREKSEQEEESFHEFERTLRKLNDHIHHLEREYEKRLPGGVRDDFKYDQNRLSIVEKHSPKIFTPDELKSYKNAKEERNRLRDASPSRPKKTLAVTEVGSTPRKMHVLIRGNPHAPGDPVQPHFPRILDQPKPEIHDPANGRTSGRRTALADWITSRENPLTARVWVNRVWQYHFGRGLVTSPNNFGLEGNAPTHPQLLDWLAVELMDNGWRLKDLHRRIMNSATYQMSSAGNDEALAMDPTNKLLWRFNMRRLTAEELRDSILFVNDRLNRKMGGPSIYPKIPAEVLAGQSRPGEGWGHSSPDDAARRSVYIFVKRSLVTPLIASFDGADTDFTCPVRFTTTQPTQALSMMNGPYLREQASRMKELVDANTSETFPDKVAYCLRRVLQRDPDAAEIRIGVQMINELMKEDGLSRDAALHSFCVVALNMNEFVYVD